MYGSITTYQLGQMRHQELEAEVAGNRRGKAVKAGEPNATKMVAAIMLIGAVLVTLFLA